MSIPGHATPQGARQFAEKFQNQYSENAYKRLGRTELLVSQLGFGTYRCHGDAPQHKEALKFALDKGCNVIDTSANYTDGHAEMLIGEALNREIVWGELKRENLLVVSKAGYIQGENMEIALNREKDQNPFPEVVKYQQGMWHCIHPDFIEDQITRSLSRMHLDTLDVYLLHNPEYFLSHVHKRKSADREAVWNEFYERIRRAFIKMEKLADEGLIRYYGISSNNFPLGDNSPEFVSLTRVWKAYQDACLQNGKAVAEGRFAVIQLPFNWLEHRAATLKNNEYQGEKYTILELARNLDLGVLINRPLNAIYEERVLLRLARCGFREGTDYQAQFNREIQSLQETENAILKIIGERNIDAAVQENKLSDFFQNSARLRHLTSQVADVSQFKQAAAYYIAPVVGMGGKTFLEYIPPSEKTSVETLVNQYFQQYKGVAETWMFFLDSQNYQRIAHLEQQFDKIHPKLADELTLSQKSLLLAASVPEIDVVLNGMRTPEYVADSMKVMEIAESISPEKLLGGKG